MTRSSNHLRRTILSITVLAILTSSTTALAGRKSGGGGKSGGLGGSVSRSFSKSNAGNRGKSNTRQQIQNRAKSASRNRGIQAIRTSGQQFVKQQAQSRGITKSQLSGNRDRVRQSLTDKAKNTFVPQAKDIVRNRGKEFAKQQFQHSGSDKAKQLKHFIHQGIKNHGKNYDHKFRHHHKHNYIGRNNWCHYRPRKCHWWYDRCDAIRYYQPQHCVNYDWNYVTCDASWNGHVITDARWYMGLKATLLPGTGLGIESVTPGSPAAAAGLQSGMIITEANGVALVDETMMPNVLWSSGGVLNLIVLVNADAEPQGVTLQLQRVASLSY